MRNARIVARDRFYRIWSRSRENSVFAFQSAADREVANDERSQQPRVLITAIFVSTMRGSAADSEIYNARVLFARKRARIVPADRSRLLLRERYYPLPFYGASPRHQDHHKLRRGSGKGQAKAKIAEN